MTKGFIYIVSNESMPNIVKIGCTQDINKRLDSLHDTSTPTPFILEKSWEVDNMYQTEKFIHQHLSYCRLNKAREFFTITPINAIELIDNIIIDKAADKFLVYDKSHQFFASSPKDIGDFIRIAAKGQNITQAQLAGVSNTGVRCVIDIMAGKKTAQIGKVMDLTHNLGYRLAFVPRNE